MSFMKIALIFKCYFLRTAHSIEKSPFMMVFPSGTHFLAESTEAMRIGCLAQGYIMLMQPG